MGREDRCFPVHNVPKNIVYFIAIFIVIDYDCEGHYIYNYKCHYIWNYECHYIVDRASVELSSATEDSCLEHRIMVELRLRDQRIDGIDQNAAPS